MAAPSATCELYVDGVRVPDTAEQLEAGLVTAMDGLSLRWGRDGQNEQPGPAALTVDLSDPAGNDDILDVLHVGSQVAVWAEGSYTQDADDTWVETVDDPTFQSYPLGSYIIGSTRVFRIGASGVTPFPTGLIADVAGRGHVAATDMSATASTGSPRITMIMSPLPYQNTGETPDAWDTIPRPPAGTTDKWRYRCRFKAPAGATVTIYPCGHKAPYRTDYVTDQGYPLTATGGWDSFEVEVKPVTRAADPAGYWQGLVLVVSDISNVWWSDQQGTWAEQGSRTWNDPTHHPEVLVDDLSIGMPGGAVVTRRVLMFAGAVSDIEVGPAGDGLSTAIRATAMDLGAELGNTVIGDAPWPANEWLFQRLQRICTLAGVGGTRRIDDPLNNLRLSYRDVDAQPAFALMQDLAQTAGGVLWIATHATTGAYVWIENPATRAAVQQLVESGGVVTIAPASRGVSLLSACDLLEDPVTWRQDTADVITVVAVTWLEQGTDDDGQPTTTERTVTVKDQDAIDGTNGKPKLGTRRLSVSTDLMYEADATAMANRILAQARAVAWRLDGLTIDTGVLADWEPADDEQSVPDPDRQITLLNLLDGTSRMGAALTLVDMPAYAPRGAVSSVYVEGGTYVYSGGYWVLQLTTTPSAGQGVSVTWAQLATTHPTWRWNQLDPEITWVDLYGVTI